MAALPLPRRFTDLVGCAKPLQLAGMGGSSTAELAVAVSRAGGLGMVSGVGGAAALAGLLDAVPADVVEGIGVNFLVPFLDPSAVEVASARARVVELFWGAPDGSVVARIHEGAALSAWQVGSADEAGAAVDAGCDVVIAQGVRAGGHVRGSEELATLLPAVRSRIGAVPLVAAGGIGTAADVRTMWELGADAVRIGTRFLAAAESDAHPDYVARLIGATAEDTVLTTAFGEGWPDAPHRVLRSAVEAGERSGTAQRWTPDWPSTRHAGPVDAKALYAGTSVGAVTRRQPAAAIVDELLG